MEDIQFLDPPPLNSADVDEFPAYPMEFPQIFNEFLPIPSTDGF
jgi:hypothetical protein